MILELPKHKTKSSCKCNKCGKEIFDDGYFGIRDYIMPYGSTFDYDTMDLILCVKCLDEFVSSCKISPITEYSKSGK